MVNKPRAALTILCALVLATVLLSPRFVRRSPQLPEDPARTDFVNPTAISSQQLLSANPQASASQVAALAALAPDLPPSGVARRGTADLGSLFAEIADGPFRQSLLKLSSEDQTRALQRLVEENVPKEDYASLRASTPGDLFYVCACASALHAGHSLKVDVPVAVAPATSGPVAAPVSVTSPPIRHSRPGAPNVIYLDFNGHTITATIWNLYYGQSTFVARPYDTDGDATTFSDSEQTVIIKTWERVAEDFAPFDVDVTTEEPAVFNRNTGRALITPGVDANGVGMPDADVAGGVAYLNKFGASNYAYYSPALVYNRSSAEVIAETVSHEMGHNLGLDHDGQTTGVEYYEGHGTGAISWAPIMGTGWDYELSQWSKGEYYRANNTEDDFAIISGHIGYRTDEAGDTLATAASITGNGETTQKGILSKGTDADLYRFSSPAGDLVLGVKTYDADSLNQTRGGNADIKIELLDASGAVLASADALDSPDASLNHTVSTGTYYVRLSAVGAGNPLSASPTGYTNYSSTGQYTLTLDRPLPPPPVFNDPAASASAGAGQFFSYAVLVDNYPSSYSATGLPPGLVLDTGTGQISGRATQLGSFTVTIVATNDSGSATGILTLTVIAAVPGIVSQSTGPLFLTAGAPGALSVSVISPSGPATIQWRRNGRLIPDVTAQTLNLTAAAVGHSGYYQAVATNAIGSSESAPMFVHVVPASTQLVAWGDNEDHQLTPPAPLPRVASVAAGTHHTLALRTDGTVVAWGDNASGQTTIPAELGGVAAIAAGLNHSLALRAEGTVVGWGAAAAATPPSDLSNVVMIAAGDAHSLALKGDGTVVAWGESPNGETTVPADLTNVVAIDAGGHHSLALKADGTVVAWGLGSPASVPLGLAPATAIAGGSLHSLAAQATGVSVWGLATFAKPPAGLTGVRTLVAGDLHSLALKTDGTVVAWGSDPGEANPLPTGLTEVFALSAGGARSYALRDASVNVIPIISSHPWSQTVLDDTTATFTVVAGGGDAPVSYQWRRDGIPLLNETTDTLTLLSANRADIGDYDVVVANYLGSTTSRAAHLTVTGPPSIIAFSPPRQVLSPGQPLVLQVEALGTDPLSYQWYRNGRLLTGATANTYSVPSADTADAGAYWVIVTDIFGPRRSALAFVSIAPASTKLVGWGQNSNGALTFPANVSNIVGIAAGSRHVVAYRADGTVLAWGLNNSGQATVPAGLTDVVAVAAGDTISFALKADGTVVSWGTSAYASVPAGLKDVIAIAAGNSHGLALKGDGTVVAWGSNANNQTSVPGTLANVVAIAANNAHSLALRANGTVAAWGLNTSTQTTVPSALLTAGAAANATALAAGHTHSLALRSTGAVLGWGTSSYRTPPSGLNTARAIAAGETHSLALKADGTVVFWGVNGNGQGTIPAGLANVCAIGAGKTYSIALRADSTGASTSTTFATFLARYFTTAQLANPLLVGDAADPDRDGLANLLEYALGLDPLVASSEGRPTVSVAGAYLQLTYLRQKDASDLTYVVEASGDLTTWQSGAAATVTVSTTVLDALRDRIVVRDLTSTDATPRFLRLRVVRTP